MAKFLTIFQICFALFIQQTFCFSIRPIRGLFTEEGRCGKEMDAVHQHHRASSNQNYRVKHKLSGRRPASYQAATNSRVWIPS